MSAPTAEVPGDTAHNVAIVRARVAAAARAAGRDPATVALVAASKTVSPARVREAIAAGQTLFGENRAQELRDKTDAVGAGARWHFIGSLQRTKIKYVVGRVEMLESLDSLALAVDLSERVENLRARGELSGPYPLPVLVQVRLSDEARKHGVAPADALELCRAASALPGIAVRGLMAVPPWFEDPAEGAPCFQALADLAAQGRAEGLDLGELSMGMSHDFEVAIAAGATIVRVGTAIFGERQPQAPAT